MENITTLSAHTPAPWSAEKDTNGLNRVTAKDFDELPLCICEVFGDPACSPSDSNACLIAAAPELLEVLKKAKEFVRSNATTEADIELFNEINAVITKAE